MPTNDCRQFLSQQYCPGPLSNIGEGENCLVEAEGDLETMVGKLKLGHGRNAGYPAPPVQIRT